MLTLEAMVCEGDAFNWLRRVAGRIERARSAGKHAERRLAPPFAAGTLDDRRISDEIKPPHPTTGCQHGRVPSLELQAALTLAKLYQSTGRPAEARATLAPAL
jgi:hypothetical protein